MIALLERLFWEGGFLIFNIHELNSKKHFAGM
jgi:hypothetical protein